MRVLPIVVLMPLLTAAPLAAAEAKAVAVVASGAGTILARAEGGATWRPLQAKAALVGGEHLVALDRAALDAKDGAVRLLLLGAVADETPVQECGVVLHDDPAVDLDFTLSRGRIDLTNLKKE